MAEKTKKAKKKKKAPVVAAEDAPETVEDVMADLPDRLPVLPARDIVAFPSVMMSLYVGRALTINAIEAAMAGERLIFIVTQKEEAVESPGTEDLYEIGVIANIVRTLKMSDGGYKVLMQGLERARLDKLESEKDYLVAKVTPLATPEDVVITADDQAVIQGIRENLQVLVENDHLAEEMLLVTEEIEDPGVLADVIVAHYKLDVAKAQSMLEQLDPAARLRMTEKMVKDDLNQFVLSQKIQGQAQEEMTKGQREYYLREQLRQIHKELGENESPIDDLEQLKEALAKAKLPEQAAAEAKKQYGRLERMSQESSEYALLRTYLEWLADLPWAKESKDQLNLKQAKVILDEDHFGLDKSKDRILEYLSVRKLKSDSKGPILCFVGPPGVGKTSLGRSIARALGREFVRMSLGGVRDEAEIRGHRRTYVGALPGRIIQGLKQAATKNPVFLLDELDKVGADFRGDPASALLEVLDPHQNSDFRDHYLNVPFDLSDVLWIATANILDTIPEPLLDRLEIIHISGYTTEEKLKICQRFLVPRQMEENGLGGKKITFDESALLFLIERYTREAGVRNLEREVGSLCRKLAREFAEKGTFRKKVTEAVVREFLGTTKYDPELDEREDLVGMARGLAWTMHGGEMLPIETSIAKGSGKLTLTGSLGNVMQESAQAAMFYARANAELLGIDPKFMNKYDIHIHVPGGATPKDGPSAGITMVAALVSALSGRKISKDVAMTGEITLRGNVLPIGGLKEKALAALRYGIKNVMIPHENLKDLDDIPKEQRDEINFVPVKHVSEVLDFVLLGKKSGPLSISKPRISPRRRKPTLSA